MADIYGRATTFGGAMTADETSLTFHDFQTGFLVQRMDLGYAQTISRIYELAGETQYYVVGRPQGNAALARVVGPARTTAKFVSDFGNPCNAAKNTINISSKSGFCTGTGRSNTGQLINYILSNCVITNLSLAVQSQDLIINEAYQLMFVGLSSRS